MLSRTQGTLGLRARCHPLDDRTAALELRTQRSPGFLSGSVKCSQNLPTAAPRYHLQTPDEPRARKVAASGLSCPGHVSSLPCQVFHSQGLLGPWQSAVCAATSILSLHPVTPGPPRVSALILDFTSPPCVCCRLIRQRRPSPCSALAHPLSQRWSLRRCSGSRPAI